MSANQMGFDFSRMPITVLRQVGNPIESDVMKYYEALDRIIADKKQYIVIVDMTHSGQDSLPRDLGSAWLKKNEHNVKAYNLQVVLVVPNVLIRGIIKAFFMFNRVPSPTVIVQTFAEAEEKAEARLRELKLPIPPRPADWPKC